MKSFYFTYLMEPIQNSLDLSADIILIVLIDIIIDIIKQRNKPERKTEIKNILYVAVNISLIIIGSYFLTILLYSLWIYAGGKSSNELFSVMDIIIVFIIGFRRQIASLVRKIGKKMKGT